MNLRQLGLVEQAEFIEANYGGGETASGLHATLDYLGWDYSTTTRGDVRLLDWCDRTHRSAAVALKDNHVVYFSGWVNGSAQIIDPNTADEYEYWTREEFLREWRYQGGWATAIVATPIPRS